MSLKFVKGFTRIRKVRAFFIQGRDLKRATDFERSKRDLLCGLYAWFVRPTKDLCYILYVIKMLCSRVSCMP